VTSAIAGPALGGVPVTHRGTAVAIHVVNAHGDLGPADLAALRDPGTTTVLMMGVEWLPRLVRQALLNGVDPRTPVAVVQNASLPEQREVRATLGTVVEVIHEAGIGFPAVITVGRNAAEGFLEPEPLPGSDFSPVPQDIRGSGREALPGVVDPGSPVGPTAVLCAHGTHSRQGRDVIRSIMSQAAALLPGTPVREAYVDVQSPEVRHVVATVAPNSSGKRTRPEVGPRAVVVPLLLATGYHVRHDIGDAVRGREAVAAPPLGPDVRIAQVLAERLREAGAVLPEVDRLASAGTAADPSVGVPDAVVLAVAGTRDEAGAAQAHVTAQQLSELIGTDVRVGYVAAASPSVAEAVAAAREEITAAAGADTGRRVVVASCLLVPGYFQSLVEKAAKAGADVVTAPLGDHELLAQIVADRFLAAVGD
jgi:sirohydrochlorin ferrochelatase